MALSSRLLEELREGGVLWPPLLESELPSRSRGMRDWRETRSVLGLSGEEKVDGPRLRVLRRLVFGGGEGVVGKVGELGLMGSAENSVVIVEGEGERSCVRPEDRLAKPAVDRVEGGPRRSWGALWLSISGSRVVGVWYG